MKTIREYKICKVINPSLPDNISNTKITGPKQVVKIIRALLGDMINIQENFFIFYLNSTNNVVGYTHLFSGTSYNLSIDIKLIALHAIKSMAINAIVAHNHPSGSLSFSKADNDITDKIKTLFDILNINFYDHIIVTEHSANSVFNYEIEQSPNVQVAENKS